MKRRCAVFAVETRSAWCCFAVADVSFTTNKKRMNHVIEEYLSYMLAQKGSLPRTIATYRDSLTNAADYFVREKGAAASWTTLVTDDFRAWEAEQMQRGYSASYVKRNMAALRSMYKFLLREGRVKVDPVRLVKNPKQQKRLPTFVRESEMDRLFDYYDFGEGYIGIRNRTILLLLYHTGIRASELIGLDVSDIDLGGQSLRVTGKGDKQRVVPFGQELRNSLRDYLRARDDFFCMRDHSSNLVQMPHGTGDSCNELPMCAEEEGGGNVRRPLFLTQHFRPMAYAELRVVVTEALSAVTTQKRRGPHVLRHSFATAMLAHGAQLEAIQQILGHEKVATTAIYTHTTLSELKKQYAAAHPRNEEH